MVEITDKKTRRKNTKDRLELIFCKLISHNKLLTSGHHAFHVFMCFLPEKPGIFHCKILMKSPDSDFSDSSALEQKLHPAELRGLKRQALQQLSGHLQVVLINFRRKQNKPSHHGESWNRSATLIFV